MTVKTQLLKSTCVKCTQTDCIIDYTIEGVSLTPPMPIRQLYEHQCFPNITESMFPKQISTANYILTEKATGTLIIKAIDVKVKGWGSVYA